MDVKKVKVIPDLVYISRNGAPLYVDLYLPEGFKTPLPVIVWLHGGGWKIGDRKLGPNLSRYFAASGFAMASIEYRLSSEAKFPAQVHDVKAAIRWIRSVAGKFGLDRNRIGLWGSSSGGHLAALAGITGTGLLEEEEIVNGGYSCDVQAVVDGYGPVNFLQMDAQRKPIAELPDDPESVQLPKNMLAASPDSFESQLLGAPIETVPEKVMEASPVTYVKNGTPPFLIMHGVNDTAVPVQQSQYLYEKLAEKGNEATLILIEGVGHGFLNKDDFGMNSSLKATIQTTINGNSDKLTECLSVGFGTIETFFRKHLMDK